MRDARIRRSRHSQATASPCVVQHEAVAAALRAVPLGGVRTEPAHSRSPCRSLGELLGGRLLAGLARELRIALEERQLDLCRSGPLRCLAMMISATPGFSVSGL